MKKVDHGGYSEHVVKQTLFGERRNSKDKIDLLNHRKRES